MKLRISLLTILIGMLFASCGLSTGKVAEQKDEGISVLRYDKLLSEYVRSNSFSAMQKLTMDYRQPTKILIEDVLSIGTVKDDTISQRLQKFYSDSTLLRLLSDVEAKYPNLDGVEKGLTKGFRKLKKEVPDTKVPLFIRRYPHSMNRLFWWIPCWGSASISIWEKTILFINVSITIINVLRCARNGLYRIVSHSIFSAVTD